ncbi:hypothetical protein COY95_02435 [Candidatus Woesearchaeota archaeon CG_4_10_14_0_8_um_filter_47_5]|nr:MAG: hypothetical protein COY95_02435 [Candidatus Woesearchaeota archaeon CG_4_10_14_0_8_um_filter_47_5]
MGRPEELADWTERLIRHRDMFYNRIQSLERGGHTIKVSYPDKVEEYFVFESLEILSDVGPGLEHAAFPVLVTYNSKKNIDELLNHWKFLASLKNLKVIFFNPDSEEKHWSLYPATHDKITTPESRKKGIMSLHASALGIQND